jgi:hypothetical protein
MEWQVYPEASWFCLHPRFDFPTLRGLRGYKLHTKRRQEGDIPIDTNFCSTRLVSVYIVFLRTTWWAVTSPEDSCKSYFQQRLPGYCKQMSIFLTYVYKNWYIMRRQWLSPSASLSAKLLRGLWTWGLPWFSSTHPDYVPFTFKSIPFRIEEQYF